jgi:ubiquinone/menaquinone biosynthesis C-methylase UbiE
MNSSDHGKGVREVFKQDANRYDDRQYRKGQRTLIADRQTLVARMLRQLGLQPGARVLDVACGPGYFALDAASLDFRPVGIDSSPDMLRTARARLEGRAQFVQGDAEALPFASASFDAVNCSGLLEYLPDPVPAMREMQRVLKPGQRAMIASTNRLSPALLLEPVIDATRRSAVARGILRRLPLPFDEASLRERKFRLTFHTPDELQAMMTAAGFERPELHFYHLQLLPHPLERLTPRIASAIVRMSDNWLASAPRRFAEGLLAVARRPQSGGRL